MNPKMTDFRDGPLQMGHLEDYHVTFNPSRHPKIDHFPFGTVEIGHFRVSTVDSLRRVEIMCQSLTVILALK